MSTQFNSVSNGQTIDAQHVNRYIEPIQYLESGEAWYRESSGTANAIKVNFATTANPVSAYTPGLIVHFKANATNTGAATLTITGPSGDLSAISLVKKGGVALAAGDISSGQVIAAIYTEDSGGANKRFEVFGGISSGGGGGLTSPVGIADGGTGATTASAARTALGTDDAANITTGTLGLARGGTGANLSATGGAGQVLKQSTAGGAVSVGALAAGDMPSGIDPAKLSPGTVSSTEFGYLDGVISPIQTQINGKAATSHTHAAGDITSGELGVARGGTGASTAAGARTNLDVPSNADLTSGLAAKQNTSEKNAANGYAGLDSGSKLSSSQMSEVMPLNGLSDVSITSPATGQTVRYNGTGFVNAALSPGDVGAAPATHTHAAGDITSGELGVARGGTGASTAASARTNLDVPSNADLSSGLAAKQSTSEKNAANGYAGLDSGGQVPVAQGGTGANLSSTGGTGQVLKQSSAGADISVGPLVAGDLPSHNHDMADITSGSLGLARGGTGANLSSTGGTGQVLKQTTVGGSVTVGALTASEMPSGIDPAKLSPGTVSSTEFGYLDGVTSSLQGQLNNKKSVTLTDYFTSSSVTISSVGSWQSYSTSMIPLAGSMIVNVNLLLESLSGQPQAQGSWRIVLKNSSGTVISSSASRNLRSPQNLNERQSFGGSVRMDVPIGTFWIYLELMVNSGSYSYYCRERSVSVINAW